MQTTHIARVGFVVSLILSGVTGAFAASFSNISGNEKEAIDFLTENGVVSGYVDGTFKPENTINRAELLKILVGSVGITPSVNEYHDCFPDVANQWFAPFVCYAKEKGWINGYPDGTFKPEKSVATVEAIKMIVNVYGYQPMQTSSTAPFSDVDLNAWYAPYVILARNAGILDVTSGELGVAADITRGRVSGIIYTSMKSRVGERTHPAASDEIDIVHDIFNAFRRGGGGNGANAQSSSETVLLSPTISLSDIGKNYGDASFTLSPTSNSAGTFSYVSSNTSVATIAGNTVTIIAVGTTTITVNQAANGNYAAGSTTATLTVSTVAPDITFNSISKTYGDATFSLSPTSDSAGAFSYISSNANVATVTGSTVTIIGAGTTTITATQAASGSYTTGSSATTLTVAKATPVIASIDDISVLSRDYSGVCLVDPDAFIASCDDSGYLMLDFPASTSTANFTSLAASNGSVVDVSNGSFDYAGFLNIVADFRYGFIFDSPGSYPDTLTTTATLHQAANANFNAGSTTFTITVTPTNLDSEDNFICLNWGVYIRNYSGAECMCQTDYTGAQCDQFIGV